MPVSIQLRRAATLVGLALAVLAVGCGDDAADSGAAAGEKLDKVTVQLDYQVRGNHGMFHVAKEQGFFADQGIDVEEIRIGTGSPDAMKIVGGGGADFGFGDLPTLVSARSQGVPVTALAAVNQTSPLGMCTKSERHELNSPEDLKGLTFGAHTAGSTYIFYKALLAANGLDRSELTERSVTPPYENYLLQDRVDVVTCYIDAEVPELEAKAGGDGSLSILLGSENGYDVYGSGLFTSQNLIDENPELVQRFVNAYVKAFEYVTENPDEAAQILADSSPELKAKKDVFREQLQADIEHTFTSELTDEKGLGAMDPAIWEKTVETLASQKVIETVPEVDSLYDERFVEKAAG
jgi:NitT/TauT family transport system substrate-binding protein